MDVAMPTNSSHSAATDFAWTLDYFFNISLYLLVLTGFITLASSGGLDLAAALIVIAAMIVRGILLAQRKTVAISERWTTPLTLAYFAFFALDYFFVSRSFIKSTVHLALFGVVVRMFSLRRERDHLMLAILAFLMVLSSAVLTVDSVFLFCFAGFMLMAVSTFVLMEMRRSEREATLKARSSIDPMALRKLGVWLLRATPVLMVVILGGAAALFFVLPRMSSGYLGAYSFGTDFSTGFSDHVQLGQIGQIQQSNALVMHIQIDGDRDGHHNLYWRGTALSMFDGRGWSNLRQQLILEKQADNDFEIPAFRAGLSWNAARADDFGERPTPRGTLIHYHVLMEPIGTNVFFLAPWATRVRGNYRLLSADSGGALRDLDSEHPITNYEAESDLSTPSPNELGTSGNDYPPQVVPAYLQLPPVDPRIRSLASQVAGTASNNFSKAAAIEKYLKTHYGYTLQLQRTPVKDPLADFLFERRQGHCEYFASAMTVMLRTLGIPARVVNGFRSDEFNDVTGNYVVRAKDAHAWVEAYFPGYGWQTFDPTPASNSGTPQGWGRVALYVDAAASFWREWVVSYDSSHQYVLGQSAVTQTRDLWERMRSFARVRYAAMLRWARHRQERIERSPGAWIGIGLAVALLLAGLRNSKWIARCLREKWSGLAKARGPEHAAALWYERMARSVERRGERKAATQTPLEFVAQIGDADLRTRVTRFTQAYESARFGKSAEDGERLPHLYEEIESAAKK
jgi:transglutaminase-like putative cysteine protease